MNANIVLTVFAIMRDGYAERSLVISEAEHGNPVSTSKGENLVLTTL